MRLYSTKPNKLLTHIIKPYSFSSFINETNKSFFKIQFEQGVYSKIILDNILNELTQSSIETYLRLKESKDLKETVKRIYSIRRINEDLSIEETVKYLILSVKVGVFSEEDKFKFKNIMNIHDNKLKRVFKYGKSLLNTSNKNLIRLLYVSYSNFDNNIYSYSEEFRELVNSTLKSYLPLLVSTYIFEYNHIDDLVYYLDLYIEILKKEKFKYSNKERLLILHACIENISHSKKYSIIKVIADIELSYFIEYKSLLSEDIRLDLFNRVFCHESFLLCFSFEIIKNEFGAYFNSLFNEASSLTSSLSSLMFSYINFIVNCLFVEYMSISNRKEKEIESLVSGLSLIEDTIKVKDYHIESENLINSLLFHIELIKIYINLSLFPWKKKENQYFPLKLNENQLNKLEIYLRKYFLNEKHDFKELVLTLSWCTSNIFSFSFENKVLFLVLTQVLINNKEILNELKEKKVLDEIKIGMISSYTRLYCRNTSHSEGFPCQYLVFNKLKNIIEGN